MHICQHPHFYARIWKPQLTRFILQPFIQHGHKPPTSRMLNHDIGFISFNLLRQRAEGKNKLGKIGWKMGKCARSAWVLVPLGARVMVSLQGCCCAAGCRCCVHFGAWACGHVRFGAAAAAAASAAGCMARCAAVSFVLAPLAPAECGWRQKSLCYLGPVLAQLTLDTHFARKGCCRLTKIVTCLQFLALDTRFV